MKSKATTESKATTKSTWARTPASVVSWHDFINQASVVAWNDATPQYDEPRFTAYKVSGEEGVQAALEANVLIPLSTIIGSNQMPMEEFRRSSVFEKVNGKPDFILVDDDIRPVLVLEVVTPLTGRNHE